MATVTLGNIKLNWKGAYNAGTAYAIDDVVSYNGSSYVAKTATTGNLPTVTANWDLMSQAGTNGTNGTDLTSTLTAQGDILYRDGSGLAKLGAGTSGQFLKTQGTGANPVWATNTSGLIQKTYFETTTTTATSSSSFTASSLVNSIPPTSASNNTWITGMSGGNFNEGSGSLHLAVYRQINGGGYSQWRLLEGGYYLYSANTGGEHSLNLYDTTHNTTNQIDYKVYIKSENGSNTVRIGGSTAYQTMSLLEIGV